MGRKGLGRMSPLGAALRAMAPGDAVTYVRDIILGDSRAENRRPLAFPAAARGTVAAYVSSWKASYRRGSVMDPNVLPGRVRTSKPGRVELDGRRSAGVLYQSMVEVCVPVVTISFPGDSRTTAAGMLEFASKAFCPRRRAGERVCR